MNRKVINGTLVAVAAMAAAAEPALAHIGIGATSSFEAGFVHPLMGLDHLTAMIAIGLVAALAGGRAIHAWPAAFTIVMVGGAGLGMMGMPLPLVEPGILASLVVLGLLIALAIELRVPAGIAIVGLIGLFHGHAHGTEVPDGGAGLVYVSGFVLGTALLNGFGIAIGLAFIPRFRLALRAIGAMCAAIGLGLAMGAI